MAENGRADPPRRTKQPDQSLKNIQKPYQHPTLQVSFGREIQTPGIAWEEKQIPKPPQPSRDHLAKLSLHHLLRQASPRRRGDCESKQLGLPWQPQESSCLGAFWNGVAGGAAGVAGGWTTSDGPSLATRPILADYDSVYDSYINAPRKDRISGLSAD